MCSLSWLLWGMLANSKGTTTVKSSPLNCLCISLSMSIRFAVPIAKGQPHLRKTSLERIRAEDRRASCRVKVPSALFTCGISESPRILQVTWHLQKTEQWSATGKPKPVGEASERSGFSVHKSIRSELHTGAEVQARQRMHAIARFQRASERSGACNESPTRSIQSHEIIRSGLELLLCSEMAHAEDF